MAKIIYNKAFYEAQMSDSLLSAEEVWPEVLKHIKPRSVIDIGCGVGTWLKALDKSHITDYLGVDGDYVKPEALLIPKDKFIPVDLSRFYQAPRKFDLAISLEVGEHLPDQCADGLVSTLTTAADVVLFSAALPGQGGTNHINEQWPEYWAAKFAAKGYVAVDALRKPLWHNEKIAVWYRQNMILYVREALLQTPEFAALKQIASHSDPEFLTRIHPELFRYYEGKMRTLGTLEGFARFKLAPLKNK